MSPRPPRADRCGPGPVLYLWLDEVFDDSGPIGWRVSNVLVGNVCQRGVDAASGLCV